MIFRAIKDWIYCPDRFYFFTGANNVHTECAQEELEAHGVIYATNEVYNYSSLEAHGVIYAANEVYNYSSEDGFDPRLTIGLGTMSVIGRIRVRFILWLGGVKGRLWYCE